MEQLDFEAEKEQIGLILQVIDEKLKQLRVKMENQKTPSTGFLIEPSSMDHVKIACTSCDSLNKCGFCTGSEHLSASTIIECIKSIQSSKVQEPKFSCDSIAFCVQCRKLFSPSNESSVNETTEETIHTCLSFITCKKCKSSKMSVSFKEDENVPSCQSLAYCILCKNRFLQPKFSASEKSFESNKEFLAVIKSTHSKFPSCSSSLNVCSFCQIKLTKGIPHFKKVSALKEEKDTSQFQPISDIIQNIYYSQTDVEPAKSPSKTPSKSQSKDKASIKEQKTPSMSKSKEKLPPKEEKEPSKKKKGAKKEVIKEEPVEPPQDEENVEISRKPLQIISKVEKFTEKSCPEKVEEEVAGESASQIIEKRRLERLKQEKEKKRKLEMEAAKIYDKFLTKQREDMLASGAIKENTCGDDEGEKIECGFIDDCMPETDIEFEPVDMSKKFLVIKYEIEMQNYKISKLCQELKSKKRKGAAPFQLAKIKEEIKKEIKKLKIMIEYTMRAQKENPNEMWGSIPVSSVSFTQLERQSYDFEKLEMPEKPSNFSAASVLSEAERFKSLKEKEQLTKQLEKKAENKRLQCLTEKTQKLQNEIFMLKKVNDDLKQKQKFFESEREDFQPDEKLREVQLTIVELQNHIKNLKSEFDDIHLKLHEVKTK